MSARRATLVTSISRMKGFIHRCRLGSRCTRMLHRHSPRSRRPNSSGLEQKTLAESLGIPNANSGGSAGGLTNISITGTVGLGDGSGSLAKVNNELHRADPAPTRRQALCRERESRRALRIPLFIRRARARAVMSASFLPTVASAGPPPHPAAPQSRFLPHTTSLSFF
jgi:hypothetical protein